MKAFIVLPLDRIERGKSDSGIRERDGRIDKRDLRPCFPQPSAYRPFQSFVAQFPGSALSPPNRFYEISFDVSLSRAPAWLRVCNYRDNRLVTRTSSVIHQLVVFSWPTNGFQTGFASYTRICTVFDSIDASSNTGSDHFGRNGAAMSSKIAV